MTKKQYPENLIYPGERLDDLQRNGYVLIQDPSLFCFGMDAVLLAAFAAAGKKDKVLDMCTGNGVVPVLMAARGKGDTFTGIEYQKKSADLARRNAIINNMDERFFVIEGDVCEAQSIINQAGRETFDVVTCNPPYMAEGDGLVNPGDEKALARHEIKCTFEDIAREAAKLLKAGGHIYLVHRPRRLVEIMGTLKRYGLEPKRMRLVHSFATDKATMVLIDAVKGGGAQLVTEAPLIIYREKGVYTQEVKGLY